MDQLELKIPPPIVGLSVAGFMWAAAQQLGGFAIVEEIRSTIFYAFLAAGFAFELPAILAFLKNRTTINPLRIANASYLVTSGAYRISRNPMYLGMVLMLMGWAFKLASPWALLGPVTYVAYITRFQILPEERTLQNKFARAYSEYKSKVRRWI
jgi:protein-S-isoprenylcysteine O-methyltransferase Ste14